MYLELTYFLYHNLKLFSEKICNKQAQIFNDSLVLITDEKYFGN